MRTLVMVLVPLLLLWGAALARAEAPRIEKFVTIPVASVRAGHELRFLLVGTPGARGSIELAGAGGAIALHELAPGFYQGLYKVRAEDNPAGFGQAVAILRNDEGAAVAHNDHAFPVAPRLSQAE